MSSEKHLILGSLEEFLLRHGGEVRGHRSCRGPVTAQVVKKEDCFSVKGWKANTRFVLLALAIPGERSFMSKVNSVSHH